MKERALKRNRIHSLFILIALLISNTQSESLIALHQLVEVDPGGEVVLSLSAYNRDGDGVR